MKTRILPAIMALSALGAFEAKPALDLSHLAMTAGRVAANTREYQARHYRFSRRNILTPDDTSAYLDIIGDANLGYPGMQVNIREYPVDPNKPMELLSFVEYGYNNPKEQRDGLPNEALGYYVYFYNPSGKPLTYDTQITMALPAPGADVTDPAKVTYQNFKMHPQRDDWHTGGNGDNQYIFYKMKIADEDTLKIYETVKDYESAEDVDGKPGYDSILRRYVISNIFAKEDNNPDARSISYPIGRETAYSGYGRNMNGSAEASTLKSKQSNILSLKIATTPYNSLLTHTEVEMDPGGWFAASTRNKYNGLAQSILFRLPGEATGYGELKQVHYDYWKYRTQWIPITDKPDRAAEMLQYAGRKKNNKALNWPDSPGREVARPNVTMNVAPSFGPGFSFEWRTSARKKDWIKNSSDDFIWALSQEVPIDTDDIGFDDHTENKDGHNRAGGHHYYNMALWTQPKVYDTSHPPTIMPVGWNYYDDFQKQDTDKYHLGNTYHKTQGSIGWVILVDSIAEGYVPSEKLQDYIFRYDSKENYDVLPRRNGAISTDLVYMPTYNQDDYGYKDKRTNATDLGANRADIFKAYLTNAYGHDAGDNAFEVFKTIYKDKYDELNQPYNALEPLPANPENNFYVKNVYSPDKDKVNDFIKNTDSGEKLYNLQYDFSLSNSYGTLTRNNYGDRVGADDAKSFAVVKEDITLDFSFIDMTFEKDGKDYVLPITNDPVDNIPAPELPGYDDNLSFWEILIIVAACLVFGLWLLFYGGIRAIWNAVVRIIFGTVNIVYWLLIWWWVALVDAIRKRPIPKAIILSDESLIWKK